MTPEGLDLELIEAARRGSSAAFGRLVDRHQRAVRAFLRRACGNDAEADDLAQETFVTAWERIGRFRGEAGLRTWLCGIAWRKLATARRSWARSSRRETEWMETEALERPATPGQLDQRMALEAALASLPLEQRAAVALCLGGEFTHAEAAEALELPLGTVKSHVTRGRARLLQVLGEA
ncbi:RNA polymerase sigma-70 factor (ECF subfamily) [Caulobacter ginsengisoli]|uniref:RNA polymerase sigma factor n=1 Tax=Caulobacter ginsengisoli TaxID=400775 RepID=A0ABU0IPT3_9CAUL|nr:sigma-70 family RNA polymerase sigma factor [Caulobacter ginsengisoli]MDQ0464017.1 RNA polymerase sigma-70 factor (ECF subfamily) [Caulobacter ginsengisoli]